MFQRSEKEPKQDVPENDSSNDGISRRRLFIGTLAGLFLALGLGQEGRNPFTCNPSPGRDRDNRFRKNLPSK
jgi:hypothetical protein